MTIQPGAGYTFTSSSLGTNLSIEKQWAPFQFFQGPEPLTPSIAGTKVNIQPGTVNRYVPKIGEDYIDKIPPPQLTVTGEGYVLVKVTYVAAKFFPRTAEIVFVEGADLPEDTNEESYYPLAKVSPIEDSDPAAYILGELKVGSLAVNRLKAGESTAVWWWTPLSPPSFV